jgi:hypothetical protein
MWELTENWAFHLGDATAVTVNAVDPVSTAPRTVVVLMQFISYLLLSLSFSPLTLSFAYSFLPCLAKNRFTCIGSGPCGGAG